MSKEDLGSLRFERRAFLHVDVVFSTFYEEAFQTLGDRRRSEIVNKALLRLIQEEKEPAFLLPEVLHFIQRVDEENILQHYIFTSFELWLNQYSGLSSEDNYRVRAKIGGKYLPREEYQAFFPIGMGKVFPGTHFVTAHKSPDLDTTVASFWGWLDAFSARVGSALHIWNLPGGPPSQIEMDLLFREMLGPAVFSHLPKTRTILSLTGNDLMTQSGMLRKTPSEKVRYVRSDRTQKATVIVDENGYYLGDFRSIDAGEVRQVLALMNQCLTWFENSLHVELITLFSRKHLPLPSIRKFMEEIFSKVIEDSEQAQEFTDEEKERLSLLLQKVLGVPKGLKGTFTDLGNALAKAEIADFSSLKKAVLSLENRGIFDFSGKLIEDRSQIFTALASIITALHEGIQKIRSHMDTLSVVLQIKTDVFSFFPKSVSVRSDVEEIRSKMGSYHYLTVTYPDHSRFFPVGIITASSLRNQVLGTVSLRDFSNRSEMTIPSYLEVISVIDHHKTELSTMQPPLIIIKDAQSSNAIVADLALGINNRYSTSGMTLEEVKSQQARTPIPKIMQKLCHYETIFAKNDTYYIHPEREKMEYLHFLYGILDDTDLLTKVSIIDVEVIGRLLNKLKTLLCKEESSIIDFSDLSQEEDFLRKAAERILRNKDMYSLYQKVYFYREKEVEKNLALCGAKKPSTIFSDTKEINGLARVGQTKIFAKNVPTLERQKRVIQEAWYEQSKSFFEDHPDIDLYLHMISTIVSAGEVYAGKKSSYTHQDELWIWHAGTDLAIEHLKRFLSAFQQAPELDKEQVRVTFLGDNSKDLDIIFTESFCKTPTEELENSLPLAVIHYKASTINSRKSMISPYLPTLSK